MEQNPVAPVTVAFITDNNFVMQTAVAIRSLLANAAIDTHYDIRVITSDCSKESVDTLSALPCVTIVPASSDAYRDIRQLAHIPIACLLKFDLCELIPDADRVLYLDGDILVRDDLSDLYRTDLKDHVLGAVPQPVLIGTGDMKFSAGIILFDAKRMRDEHVRDRLGETRRALGEQRSMDQQSFNLLYENDYLHLDPKYNMCPMQLKDAEKLKGLDAMNTHYGTHYASIDEAISGATIIHFATGQKPWLYDNLDFSADWYACYQKTVFGNVPLKRRKYTVWISRFDGLKQAKKEEGFEGVCRFLWCAVQKKVFKKEIKNNWG